MVFLRSLVDLCNNNSTQYFSSATPPDLGKRFSKRGIEVYLFTKSDSNFTRPAASLSDRIER